MSILDRIIILLKEKHKTQKELTDFLGFTNSTFTDWKGGRSESYKKYLPQIAEFLGVSVDYLIGKTDTKMPADEIVNEHKKDLIDLLIDLTPEQFERVQEFVAGLRASDKDTQSRN